MKLLLKFNLILVAVFGVAGVLISILAYQFLIGNARREVLDQAKLMKASTQAVRDYTSTDLVPLLLQNPQHRVHFLAETVPAFGAVTTFKMLHAQYPDYTYQEAVLNPTNPQDRATDWQTDIIHKLGDHPELKEIVNQRQTDDGPSLYIASPIVAKQSCMECHSTPAVAPKAMLTVYGTANGFGWQENAVVGAQIVSVPSSVPVAIADKAFHQLLIYLALTLIFAIAALDAGVYWLVLLPIQRVASTADRVSRGEQQVPELVPQGKDEIAELTKAFNRMRVSLAKALAMLDE